MKKVTIEQASNGFIMHFMDSTPLVSVKKKWIYKTLREVDKKFSRIYDNYPSLTLKRVGEVQSIRDEII